MPVNKSKTGSIILSVLFVIFLIVFCYLLIFDYLYLNDKADYLLWKIGVKKESHYLSREGTERIKEGNLTTGSYIVDSIDKDNKKINMYIPTDGSKTASEYSYDEKTLVICFKNEDTLRDVGIDFSRVNTNSRDLYDTLVSKDDSFYNYIKGRYVIAKIDVDSNTVGAILVGGCK